MQRKKFHNVFCESEGIHCIGPDISDIVIFDSEKDAKDYAIKMIENGFYCENLNKFSLCKILKIEFHENCCEGFNLGFYKI